MDVKLVMDNLTAATSDVCHGNSSKNKSVGSVVGVGAFNSGGFVPNFNSLNANLMQQQHQQLQGTGSALGSLNFASSVTDMDLNVVAATNSLQQMAVLLGLNGFGKASNNLMNYNANTSAFSLPLTTANVNAFPTTTAATTTMEMMLASQMGMHRTGSTCSMGLLPQTSPLSVQISPNYNYEFSSLVKPAASQCAYTGIGIATTNNGVDLNLNLNLNKECGYDSMEPKAKRKKRECAEMGCSKYPQGGTSYCVGHGGGKRCKYADCTKSSRGSSGLCISHGGGKRCSVDGCAKGAASATEYCVRHGGGRRCQHRGCKKSAQGPTDYCVRHGGGNRCEFPNCNFGARGKTKYCQSHAKIVTVRGNRV